MSRTFPTETTDTYIGYIVDHKETKGGQLLYKVRVLAHHGPDVKDSDLAWTSAHVAPTLAGATFSGGAMDKGQAVYVRYMAGQGGTSRYNIVGLANHIVSGGQKL